MCRWILRAVSPAGRSRILTPPWCCGDPLHYSPFPPLVSLSGFRFLVGLKLDESLRFDPPFSALSSFGARAVLSRDFFDLCQPRPVPLLFETFLLESQSVIFPPDFIAKDHPLCAFRHFHAVYLSRVLGFFSCLELIPISAVEVRLLVPSKAAAGGFLYDKSLSFLLSFFPA